MMKKLLFILLIAATALVETSKAQELMPPEPAPVEDLRGYDWHYFSQNLGNPWSSLTDTQILYRVSRAYLLQSRIIQAQAAGNTRSLEDYMYQAMDELVVLSDQPGFVSQPQFRELYRTIIHEHEEYYGADLDEFPEYRSLLARRSTMFGTRAPREITKNEITRLSEVTPAATTEYTARIPVVDRAGTKQAPVIPRGYDRYALSLDCGNPRSSLTKDQITCRVSRAYRLQSRTIRAQADGDLYSAERYMNQVMNELVVLSNQPDFVGRPQFRELYRTIVHEHETSPDTELSEPQEYGEIFALRDAMFEAQSRMEAPLAAAVGLPRVKPVATTIPMTQNEFVEGNVSWLMENRRETIIRWLDRAETYFPMIEQIFAEEGVPDELKYLAVGESGSGKTTLANMILGVFGQSSGEIWFDGKGLPTRRTLEHRSAIQLVQQNPLSSLNPKRSVGASIRLGLDVFGIGARSDRWRLVENALEEVGLPGDFRRRPPAALSGGQCQRVAIARALACQSRLVILDEPTSALDVLVQARVLRLLEGLRRVKGLSYVFITHDLSVVRNVADRVAVFRAGKLVECAETRAIFEDPQVDYTRQLIGAVPVIADDELKLREALSGGLPA